MVFKFPKSVCRFCRHHRRKFIFAGVFVGGVYGLVKFTEYKIKDYILKEQQKANDKIKIQKSFEQVQHHSMSIATAMLSEVMEKVKQSVNTEEITKKLKSGQGDKISLWQNLKIMIFTQVITGVCSTVLLFIVLKVQLNQIAGLMFHSSVSSDDNANENQQKFISLLSDHLIQHGIDELVGLIKNVVSDQLDSMPLQGLYKASDIEIALNSICTALLQKNSNVQKGYIKLSHFAIVDSKILEEWTLVSSSVQDVVEKWLDKTADILESPDFETISLECVRKGLHYIGLQLNMTMSQTLSLTSTNPDKEFSDVIAPLAKLLPILNNQLYLICSEEFLAEVADIPALNQFLLNVFDSFI